MTPMTPMVTIGVDPHRKVFTAAALDERGRALAHAHFDNNRAGHTAALAWAQAMGTIDRVGIEGASASADRSPSTSWLRRSTSVTCHPTRRRCASGAATRTRVIASMLTV